MSKLKTNTIRHVDGSNDNITLDSSQNVTVEGKLKVGTSSTSTRPISIYSASDAQIQFQGSGTGTGNGNADGFIVGNSGSLNATLWNYEDGYLRFATNNTERGRFESGGAFQVQDNIKIMTAGKGIDFSAAADTATGETVESSVLDDYEEGSFVPSFNGSDSGGTAQLASGNYTKIGDLCHIDIMLTNANGSVMSGGTINCTGLPFVCKRDSRTTNIFCYKVAFDTAHIQSWNISDGDSYLWGYQSRDDTTWTSWPSSDFDTNGIYMRISMTYKVD